MCLSEPMSNAVEPLSQLQPLKPSRVSRLLPTILPIKQGGERARDGTHAQFDFSLVPRGGSEPPPHGSTLEKRR